MFDTPFENGSWIAPAGHNSPTECRQAARALARQAGEDREGLLLALQALGLMEYRPSGAAREA